MTTNYIQPSGNRLHRLHRKLGRSPWATKLALKVKNQMSAIIRCSLNDGIHPDQNGEHWLMQRVAGDLQFFVDVGANVGEYSSSILALTDSSCKGLAFEPSPLAFAALSTKLAAAIDKRLSIFQMALSDSVGVANFHMESNSGETSSLVRHHSQVDAQVVQIQTTTLDAAIKRFGDAQRIDLVKIDAEGFDLRVLKGASELLSNHRVAVIQFEYNAPWAFAGSTLADALDLLADHGYSVRLLKREGLVAFDYAKYGDFFGYANFVAFLPGDLRFETSA